MKVHILLTFIFSCEWKMESYDTCCLCPQVITFASAVKPNVIFIHLHWRRFLDNHRFSRWIFYQSKSRLIFCKPHLPFKHRYSNPFSRISCVRINIQILSRRLIVKSKKQEFKSMLTMTIIMRQSSWILISYSDSGIEWNWFKNEEVTSPWKGIKSNSK